MIIRVPKPHAKVFFDRKNNTSMNIQVVVGPDMRIYNFVNRFPGSFHDSRILENSSLGAQLQSEPPAGHLLGDAGYPLHPYLLTPFRAREGAFDHLSPAELRYQKAHTSNRNLIERFFGAWKSKFACLQGKMRLRLETALLVINACAMIWNFLITLREELIPEEEVDEYLLPEDDCRRRQQDASAQAASKEGAAAAVE